MKNVDPSTINLNIVPEALSLSIKYPTTGSEYSLELDLCHPIDPKQSTHTVLKTQVEIKLKKVSAIAWKSLEASQITCPNVPQPVHTFHT
jgi:suppressor of G2 allele of SKP1